MNLFVCGLRRSGTTIVYDALSEDPELRCFYEPLREDSETIGGGSGAHPTDLSAETRELREAFRREHYPELQIELFNWGGPRAAEVELEPDLPEHVRGTARAPARARLRTSRSRRRGCTTSSARWPRSTPTRPSCTCVRDPRAVTASMLLGRRRRTDIYPDAETFFTARTGRRLWSSRRISEDLIARRRSSLDLPADIPDFLRPLLVWKSAFETMAGDGPRLFGDRYALLRLEDLRTDPPGGLERIYGLIGGTPPDRVAEWVAANLRRDAEIHLRDDPRWARAARLLKMEPELEAAGYGEILELEPAPGEPLDLTPPAARSRLAGFMGRARRRQRSRVGRPCAASPDARLDPMKARVLIRPKEGILDPQGKAVERALPALGFEGISDVRVGRHGRARGGGRRRPRPPLRAAARQPPDRGLRDRAMRFGVLQFPGSCDERDAVLACERVGDAGLVWHGDRDLSGFDALVIPGGFSYGDYLRAGAIARFAPAMEAVAEFAAGGGPVLGICNGFQVLCEAGLLPGALLPNQGLRFVCRQVDVEVVNAETIATAGCEPGTTLSIPVKHMSGRWFAPARPARAAGGERPGRLPLRAGAEPERLGRRRRRGLQRARQRRRPDAASRARGRSPHRFGRRPAAVRVARRRQGRRRA